MDPAQNLPKDVLIISTRNPYDPTQTITIPRRNPNKQNNIIWLREFEANLIQQQQLETPPPSSPPSSPPTSTSASRSFSFRLGYSTRPRAASEQPLPNNTHLSTEDDTKNNPRSAPGSPMFFRKRTASAEPTTDSGHTSPRLPSLTSHSHTTERRTSPLTKDPTSQSAFQKFFGTLNRAGPKTTDDAPSSPNMSRRKQQQQPAPISLSPSPSSETPAEPSSPSLTDENSTGSLKSPPSPSQLSGTGSFSSSSLHRPISASRSTQLSRFASEPQSFGLGTLTAGACEDSADNSSLNAMSSKLSEGDVRRSVSKGSVVRFNVSDLESVSVGKPASRRESNESLYRINGVKGSPRNSVSLPRIENISIDNQWDNSVCVCGQHQNGVMCAKHRNGEEAKNTTQQNGDGSTLKKTKPRSRVGSVVDTIGSLINGLPKTDVQAA